MRARFTAVLLLAVAACFHASNEPDSGMHNGGGSGGGGSGGGGGTEMTCLTYQMLMPETVCAPKEPVICSGVTCADGEQCCLTTGQCFAAANAATACPNARGDAGCASNADCEATDFCNPSNPALCGGPGTCLPRNNCGFCSPPNTPQCAVCGCNGVSYESVQAACVAGIPHVTTGFCGTLGNGGLGPQAVLCGTDSQCPTGMNCCFQTGKCFDGGEAWRCPQQPDAAVLDCASSSECGGSGGSGGSDTVCAGNGCEGSPGACVYRPNDCGGQLDEVCGCDNVTYTNECWALHAGVRVQSTGKCP